MARNVIETVMGGVVLVVAGGFLAFAYQQSSVKSIDGYIVNAAFNDISGVTAGSDVRIGGVKVGVVDSLSLDPKTYQALASLQVKQSVQLPKDTSAAISSDGLLGGKYVKLEAGGSDEMLKGGDRIKFTQSSVSLEELIGKFVFSGGGVDKKEEGGAPAPAPVEKKDETATEKKDNPFSLGF